jgi:hypothetical protein
VICARSSLPIWMPSRPRCRCASCTPAAA